MSISNDTHAPLQGVTAHPVTVLLVDDQVMVGEAVRRMLADESDVIFHYCADPSKAIETANSINPTIILQDLVMPDIDGLSLLKFYRANPGTKEVPVIVLSTKEEAQTKADAFAQGANDYIVKLPDRIELLARIRHHSHGYINLLQRNEAWKALAEELAEAATYVTSLLPTPLEGAITTDWRFITSTQLGGDAFGYHQLDDNLFAIYLLDVCGHGVGAALLSISVMNVLRTKSLPHTDFTNPGEVLSHLNDAFPMEENNNKFFTMWYGVYDRAQRSLLYSSGGHPPAILCAGQGDPHPVQLRLPGPIIGGMPDMEYTTAQCDIPPGSHLYVYSDGVYEIILEDGVLWSFDEFIKVLAAPSEPGIEDLDRILRDVRTVNRSDDFDDDFSLLRLIF
ncbi:MAG: response regulator [Spartobacteria bacterium]|nr:response regulator [Spartobacteria bacterium]